MNRALTATLGLAAIGLPAANALAPTAAGAATATTAKKVVVTRKFNGPAAEADRWGTVQVTVTVRKTTTTVNGHKKVTRKLVDIGGSYSYHTDRSQYIMSQSLPMLRQAALTAQSANVDTISGATYTSDAFKQSLQAALLKAQQS
jgi:uncharacterized protein with FMN-binding domain